MGEKTLQIGTVHQCNCCLGAKTLHPLVSVIDLSTSQLAEQTDIRFGFYTLFLNECKCEAYSYGRQYYDYSDGTLTCLTPGQTISMKENNQQLPSKGWILAFHPDLIYGTSLEHNMRDYTFFSYFREEALHLSLREKKIMFDCLDKLQQEIQRCIDRHSKKIISKQIELLLDYCTRFYERQFITRHDANKKSIEQFDHLLDQYFEAKETDMPKLPSIKYLAKKLKMSPDYFCDTLKVETGKSIQEYIQFKRFELAKKWVLSTDKSIQQIAQQLGLSTNYFCFLFKKVTGYSPADLKASLIH